ncbi:Rgs1 [Phodopus roborovskii]|uniref:Rgs1 protein n=1 Tax=Phodopus roborovskii TaxID=109678 RepID=A0AAU9Z4Q4_PHORO|nr:Rgs1 [Phodopus roborovskii]
MRAAAISMPRLDKMPGMFFSAGPKDLKEPSHSLLDDKTQKKRPKTFGMDMKAYLRSMIPHLESGMKSSKSKDMYVLNVLKCYNCISILDVDSLFARY